MQTINIDYQQPGVQPIVHAKQDDSFSRFFAVSLWDGASAYTIPSGALWAIDYKSPAGVGLYDAITQGGASHAACVVSNNTVTCEIAPEVLTASGWGELCLQMYKSDGTRLNGWNISIDIEACPNPDATIVNSDYYSVLTAQIAQVLAGVSTATSAAVLSQSWAVGGTNSRPGEDTNNSKYWAEFAQSVAQGQKGYFATPEALEAAYPTGQDGWWAIVGTTDTIWLWDSDTAAWKNSGNSTDLSNYYTKSQIDTLLAGKLGVSATAADSSKLGGQLPAYYATAESLAKIITITVTASDSSSMAGQHITILDAATETEITGFDYSGQPESVQLYTGASYKIVAESKMGYVDVPPVLGVLTTDKSVTLNYIRGTRYGFQRSKTNSAADARITYLYDAVGKTPMSVNLSTHAPAYGDWEEFVNQLVTPVMLNYDGTEAYELDRDDQTKKDDGTASEITSSSFAGNAMVRFGGPFKWVKRYEDANAEYVIFCDTQFDADYHAYAHTNANGDICDRFYWAMYKGSNVSSKMRSIAGLGVMVSQTRNTEAAYAQANGDGWYTIYHSGHDFIDDVLTLLAKSDNSQAVYGYGRCASGNTAGVTPGSLKAQGAFWGASDQTSEVKVLYIEGYWGNYWEGMAGLINANGIIKAKMVPPYNFDGSGYTNTGITPGGTSGGYISAASVTDAAGFIPKTASGSGTTYYCDGLWFNNSQVNYALVGGFWSHALLCGSRSVDLNNLASYARAGLGSRLSFVPLAAS